MERIKEKLITVIYLLLAGFMYYSLQFDVYSIEVGGFNFMYFYLIGIVIILMGVLAFLVTPQVPRIWLLGKYSVEMCIPYLLSVFMSLIIWVVNLSEPSVMIRGAFFSVYQILAVLVAAATLYIFGSKGIYYNLIAILLVHVYEMLLAMREGGAAEFFRELWALLSSGAMETGSLMVRMEGLGLTYALGMYMLYILLGKKEKGRMDWLLFAAGSFFFFTSFKRSATIALIIALLAGLVLKHMHDEQKHAWIYIMGVTMVVIGMAYIWLVKSGTLDMITEALSLDTSGRNVVFDNLSEYYSFDVFYLGTGIGYVTKMMQTGELFLGINVTDLHNDFLRQYVEQGFWGYLFWLISMFIWRIRFIRKRDIRLGVLAFVNAVFCFCTYFTENTYFLFYANISMVLLMIGDGLEEQVEEERRRSTWL